MNHISFAKQRFQAALDEKGSATDAINRWRQLDPDVFWDRYKATARVLRLKLKDFDGLFQEMIGTKATDIHPKPRRAA